MRIPTLILALIGFGLLGCEQKVINESYRPVTGLYSDSQVTRVTPSTGMSGSATGTTQTKNKWDQWWDDVDEMLFGWMGDKPSNKSSQSTSQPFMGGSY